jgi:hypothetical protein
MNITKLIRNGRLVQIFEERPEGLFLAGYARRPGSRKSKQVYRLKEPRLVKAAERMQESEAKHE